MRKEKKLQKKEKKRLFYENKPKFNQYNQGAKKVPNQQPKNKDVEAKTKQVKKVFSEKLDKITKKEKVEKK